MRYVMLLVLSLLLASVLVQVTGCAVKDETFIVGGELELVTLKFENNKPKLRVATGIDYCKWRGRYDLRGTRENEIGVNCSFRF